MRTFNLARVFEHEYIGHNIHGFKDFVEESDKSEGIDEKIKAIGPNDFNIGNIYREEMELPIRTQYLVEGEEIYKMWFGESFIEINSKDLSIVKYRLKVSSTSLNIKLIPVE